VDYRRFLTVFLELYARKRGKPRVGNKTAPFVRRIEALHALWPDARFLHLIRDGRDVCLSALGWASAERSLSRYPTWGEDPISTGALWWERKVRAGREGGRSLGPPLYREVRYEALVNEPERECEALCDFLGLRFDDAMLRFVENGTSGDADLDRAHPWLPITAGLRDWRSQMAATDVEAFEAAAGELLGELGYERAHPRRGRGPEDQA
jgi:Sulfotransferase family